MLLRGGGVEGAEGDGIGTGITAAGVTAITTGITSVTVTVTQVAVVLRLGAQPDVLAGTAARGRRHHLSLERKEKTVFKIQWAVRQM